VHEEHWLLPDGIEEILPPQARRLEDLRRAILDLFDHWGYELVMAPLIDYLDSLLTGTGADLDLKTFKLTDPLSGRLLGIRADITPQAARIDAHRLRRAAPTRLCYLGTVLNTHPDGFAGNRSPLQIGAELFGHAGVESDVEVLSLMWRTLELAGLTDVYLDLGHVGIFRGLARQAELTQDQELDLFEALQRKASREIAEMVRAFGVQGEMARMLGALADLNGDDALNRARTLLAGAAPPVWEALDHLSRMSLQLGRMLPNVPVHFDLAELRGYHYKTGVVFAAFVPKLGQEVARGGRYDAIGRVFGWARPAVGFSTDLKTLLRLGGGLEMRHAPAGAIAVPWGDDPTLHEAVASLRAQGRRVLTLLPGQQGTIAELGCSEQLVQRQDSWTLEPLA
jgi:ATP phosphoribosyltransferase regulatory subunit